MADGEQAAGGSVRWRWPGLAATTLVLAVPVAISAAIYFSQADHSVMLDLEVYRWGGALARHSGPLYSAQYRGFLSFTYPPMAAVVFELLSALPLLAAKLIVITGSLLALFASAWLACGGTGVRGSWARAAAAFAVTDVVLFTDPVQQTIDFGQVNLVLMALVLADLFPWDDRWWRGAGVGLAAGLKLTPGIFIGYLLVTRRFRAAGVATAAFALTVATGFAVLPGPSRHYWLGGLFLDSSRPGAVIYASNQSLLGAIARLAGGSGPARPYWLATALVVAVCGLLAAARTYRRGRELAAVSVCAVTGLLVSPVSWDHHWVWIVPVFVAVADAAWRHRSRAAWVGLTALVLVFGSYPWVPNLPNPAQVRGLIWFVPVGGNREYGWHGWQLLAGNLYTLAGLGIACAVALAAFRGRARRRQEGRELAAEPVNALRERRLGRPARHDLLAAADHGGVAIARCQDVEPAGTDRVDHDPGHLRGGRSLGREPVEPLGARLLG
jgi:alpha-1,2-mannosyltransferase